MQILKNFIVGFLVSFIGSIPLGYLNIVGFQLFENKGFLYLFQYLVSVVVIEGIVIYATLEFAKKLSQNNKILKYIQVFSIFFLLLLAAVFFAQSLQTEINAVSKSYINYNPIILGLMLSSLNFIQIPFWTGWNIYLVNNNYINGNGFQKIYFVLGTIIGTFLGMLAFIIFLNYLSVEQNIVSPKLVSKIIPSIFLIMAIFQIYKYFQKKIN